MNSLEPGLGFAAASPQTLEFPGSDLSGTTWEQQRSHPCATPWVSLGQPLLLAQVSRGGVCPLLRGLMVLFLVQMLHPAPHISRASDGAGS